MTVVVRILNDMTERTCGAREVTCREQDGKYWERNTYLCSIIGWNVRVKLLYYKRNAFFIIIVYYRMKYPCNIGI